MQQNSTDNLIVLVISLPEAEERRRRIQKRLERQGLAFKFLPAVRYPSDFNGAGHLLYDSARRRRTFGRDLTGGEIGCFMSHWLAWDLIVSEGWGEALILEDDAILHPGFRDILAAVRRCPVPYDAIRFLNDSQNACRRQRPIYPLSNGRWLTRMETTPARAHAYLLRASGAKKLIPGAQGFWLPVDTFIGRTWDHGLKWFNVSPEVATFDKSLPSSIGDQRFNKTLSLAPREHARHLLSKAAYKIGSGIAKRWIYWKSWPEDIARYS